MLSINFFQILSEEITAKEAIVQETEREIDDARGAYKSVATHASVLFFCASDMGGIEPMYQFSLGWFINLYLQVSSFYHIFFFCLYLFCKYDFPYNSTTEILIQSNIL